MILTCPSCSAQYFADDQAIGESGRTVRCAACGHSWFAKPELSLEEKFNESDLSREKVERLRQGDNPDLAPHAAYRQKEFDKRRNGGRLAALTAWTGSALVFFGLGAGAVVKREDIVRHWPNASAAYAMAGLEVNRFGLEFGPVDAERTFDGTTPILTLSGSVFNSTEVAHSVPVVRIDMRNDHGATIDSHLVQLSEAVLSPGQAGTFSTRIDSPPLDAFDLAMSFVDPETHLIADLHKPVPHTQSDLPDADHHGEEEHGEDAPPPEAH